jgi:uncharacterized membrane protein YgcG
MKPLAALAALVIAAAASVAPAMARDSFVLDNAHLLSASTVSAINAKVGDFKAQTHKEVFVDIEPTLTGTPQAAAERVFAQQQVNGVLIFIAKSPKTIGVVPDRAAARYFPSGTTSAIRTAIVSAFNAGDFNGGVTNGVDLTLSTYRSHLGAVRVHANAPVAVPVASSATGGGFNMSIIWWLIALAVIFFIVRGIFRAIAGPRMMPPGYGGGPMGGGYGPGYGGGMGGGMGGGGFFSGLLGGLGGAFLGNELFGNRGGEMFNNGGQQAGFNDGGQSQDNSGFQSDAGQADLGNSSFGGWGGGGDSGGGWGGDSGGGGGGDFGGGGGDSGGGW